MPTLHVAFQEGFQDDEVKLFLNDVEVYKRTHLKTRMQIGLADSVDLQVPSRSAELRIVVPGRNVDLKKTITFEDHAVLFVAISMKADGALALRVSPEAFRYA